MRRKILVTAAVFVMLLVVLATPRFGNVGAWGRPAGGEEQQITANSFGSVLGAPFRALGNLFRGKKKKAPVSKITEKDIKKFESSEVSRVNDANTPQITPSTDQSTLADRIRAGRELLNAGRVNEAITELTAATSIDPKSGEAHTLLGVAYDRKGWGGRAREAFEAALDDPNDQATHLNNLGFLLYRQGEYSDAIKYLKRAAKLSPAESKIWNNLTTAQLAAEKFDDAYKSSVQVLGEFESRLKIADRLAWAGRTKDAIKHLEKARALQPVSTEVLSRLATLYAGAGQDEKAEIARQALASLLTVATAPARK